MFQISGLWCYEPYQRHWFDIDDQIRSLGDRWFLTHIMVPWWVVPEPEHEVGSHHTAIVHLSTIVGFQALTISIFKNELELL